MSHTPGPWTVEPVVYHENLTWCHANIYAESSNNDDQRCGVAYIQTTMDESAEANARLIAAAPEMLEMIRLLTDSMPSFKNFNAAHCLIGRIVNPFYDSKEGSK